MFPHSTIFNTLFWIILGLLYAFIFISAKIWAKDLGLKMNWKKWIATIIWFVFLTLVIGAAFTLFGEGESQAAWYFIGIFGFISVVLGVIVWRIISRGRIKVSDKVTEH